LIGTSGKGSGILGTCTEQAIAAKEEAAAHQPD